MSTPREITLFPLYPVKRACRTIWGILPKPNMRPRKAPRRIGKLRMQKTPRHSKGLHAEPRRSTADGSNPQTLEGRPCVQGAAFGQLLLHGGNALEQVVVEFRIHAFGVMQHLAIAVDLIAQVAQRQFFD